MRIVVPYVFSLSVMFVQHTRFMSTVGGRGLIISEESMSDMSDFFYEISLEE